MKYLKNILLIGFICIFCVVACKPKASSDELDIHERLSVLDAKIRKNEKDPSLYYARAKVYLELDQVNDALADAYSALKYDDKNSDYYLLMGDIMFLKLEMESAYSNIQKSLEIQPRNPKAYLKLAEISLYNRDYERALESIAKSLEYDKFDPTAYFLQGYIQKETGDTFAAVASYKQAIEYNPEHEGAYEELGLLYALRKDPLAAEYFNTALQINPNSLFSMYGLAMYYQDIEDVDKALELYENILAIRPDHPDALNNMGYLYMNYKEKYEEAISLFTRALAIEPDFEHALYNRAVAYETIGDKKLALEDYELLNQIDPNDEEIAEKVEVLRR